MSYWSALSHLPVGSVDAAAVSSSSPTTLSMDNYFVNLDPRQFHPTQTQTPLHHLAIDCTQRPYHTLYGAAHDWQERASAPAPHHHTPTQLVTAFRTDDSKIVTPTPIHSWQNLPSSVFPHCAPRSSSDKSTHIAAKGLSPVYARRHRQDSRVPGGQVIGRRDTWTMSVPNPGTFGATALHEHSDALEQALDNFQTPPIETAALSAPSSLRSSAADYTHIANAEYSPGTAALQAPFDIQDQGKPIQFDASALPQLLPASTYTLTAPSPAHQDMQAFAVDQHITDDHEPEFSHSSRHSMSSIDNPSPATPPLGASDGSDGGTTQPPPNLRTTSATRPLHADLRLFRTESAAYQDELYNPPTETTCATTPARKPTSKFLSPHQSVMSQRLEAANSIRSQSPADLIRQRSPFREGSDFAPTGDWKSPNGVGTAASLRQYQKAQADQAENARFDGSMPRLRREPTKTISPKDALLDGPSTDQPSLFQDILPPGYEQHNKGPDAWAQDFTNGANASFDLQPPITSNPFAANALNEAQSSAFGFAGMQTAGGFASAQLPTTTFSVPTYPAGRANQFATPLEVTPQFPATLTSMESSVSEPPSSQDDAASNSGPIQRPADTRANTGSYTCTYHNCSNRFDSHANLQKHKREVHRAAHPRLSVEPQSSPHTSTTMSSNAGTPSDMSHVSPRSTASPDPSGSGMTSAALMARNSQAGPHKCSRVNPSTGKPCNTIFSRPYDLTRHEDTIHNGRKQKVRCPMCREEKTFSRNDALTRHMRVVHPEVENFGKRGRRD